MNIIARQLKSISEPPSPSGALAIALLVACLFSLSTASQAQTQAARFDPRAAFAPLTLPTPPSLMRSASGAPGPAYWQNRADYVLHASLDAQAHVLRGEEVITYANNSPDALDSLWLQLDQNAYRRDSRSHAADEDVRRDFTDGIILESVRVGAPEAPASSTVVSDTRLRIDLAAPLRHGASTRLYIRYHFRIPTAFGGRTSWGPNPNGDIYDIAQWYPRMAVYDDIRGWDTAPYLAQEFYLEYGDFDYSITAPADMVVAGSGELVNAAEVLNRTQLANLERARASDATVTIRSAAEVAASARSDGVRTWRFRMHDTRDVAFAASRAFVWDAARINLPDGAHALAMSLYPPESAGAEAWGRSTEYIKHAVEEFSRRWHPYPWPNAINVAGPTSGMEYPGIVFDGPEDRGRTLFWISAHEIGHTWFPMIVGFDERRDAWMDEGFNTFIDVYESDAFQNGVYGPKRDSEYAPGGGNPVDEILPILADRNAPPILSRADTVAERYRHPVTYFKSALGLTLLREQILGPERFDPAFRHFIRAWAYRHPKPSDFFRAMESEAGEDLSWFWREWYFNNETYDVAVASVAYLDHDATKGAIVTLANRDLMVFPTWLDVGFADGSHMRQRVPVEAWMLRANASVSVDSRLPIVSVTVDPDHALPDRDRANNVWRGSPS
jgi:hypothetical protein